MNEQDLQKRLAERLAPLLDATFEEEDELRAEQRRYRIVSRSQHLVREQLAHRRHRKQRIFGAAAAVLAAAAALALWLKPETSESAEPQLAQHTELQQEPTSPTRLSLSVEGAEAEVAHTSGVAHLQVGQNYQLEGVTHLSTPSEGSARIEVPEHAPQAGLQIVAGPDTEVAITRTSEDAGVELLHLRQGQLDFEVPKLQPGTSLAIITPSIRVVVIGTAFTLNVDPTRDEDSCLRVSEGVVRVEKAQRPATVLAQVSAGQSWGCQSQGTEEAASQSAETGAKPEAGHPQHKASHQQSAYAGNLAKETELLARAVRLNQHKDLAGAERELQKLLSEFPHSPLAEEARRLLLRVRESRSAKTVPQK